MSSTVGRAVAAILCAGAAVLIPAAPASATATHVGIVVQFGPGRVSTACVAAGGSGLAVLERRYGVLVGRQPPYIGFVLTINGTGTTRPDDTHYWSYWRSSGTGGWAYSGSGAGSTTPAAGSVEGWSYVDGASSAPRPPSYSYAALCAGADPAPARTSSRTHAPPPPHPVATHPATTAHRIAPTAARTTTASAPRPHGTARPSRHRTPTPTRTSVTPQPVSNPTAPTPTTAAPTPAASPTASPAAHQSSESGLPAWGTVLAVVVVLALGTLAWLRMRRAP